MGYGTNGLTFNTLRDANRERLSTFRDAKGRLSHPDDKEGATWPLSQWMNAVLGELGEAANLIKKVERGDFTLDEVNPKSGLVVREELAKELADVSIYLDLIANRANVDLGRAVVDKFNEVSERVKSPIYIGDDGDWRRRK